MGEFGRRTEELDAGLGVVGTDRLTGFFSSELLFATLVGSDDFLILEEFAECALPTEEIRSSGEETFCGGDFCSKLSKEGNSSNDTETLTLLSGALPNSCLPFPLLLDVNSGWQEIYYLEEVNVGLR
jgi:hypothetical protein